VELTVNDATDIRRSTVAQWLVAAVALLGVVAFWCGVVIAARRYPSEYDWRYMTVSSLLSPDRNPAGHLWSTAGIVACGCGGFMWATLSARYARHPTSADGQGEFRAFQLGYLCTTLAAALPERFLAFPKTHEVLAILAFAGMTLGIVRSFQAGAVRRIRSSGDRGRFWTTVILYAVPVPLVLAVLAQAYVFFARPELPWVNLSWRARGVPLYLSFAFWEWVTCGLLAAYMGMLVLLPCTALARPRPSR